MANRTKQQTRNVQPRLITIADELAHNYDGHAQMDDWFKGGPTRSWDKPSLLTTREGTNDAGKPVYSLSVFDAATRHPFALRDWIQRKDEDLITSGEDAVAFEARVQRGVMLFNESGLLASQFYPQLLVDRPETGAHLSLVQTEETK